MILLLVFVVLLACLYPMYSHVFNRVFTSYVVVVIYVGCLLCMPMLLVLILLLYVVIVMLYAVVAVIVGVVSVVYDDDMFVDDLVVSVDADEGTANVVCDVRIFDGICIVVINLWCCPCYICYMCVVVVAVLVCLHYQYCARMHSLYWHCRVIALL